jgi:hypothetical protein
VWECNQNPWTCQMRRFPRPEIEDVQEPFCGCRRKYMVSLADAEPEVAAEWHYAKNAGWGPEDFSRSSSVNCWWECPLCMRIYKAPISNRTSTQRSGCPYCASKKICNDNSFSVQYPELAKEWHPTRNGKLKPSQVMRASSKHVWWLCSACQHEWKAAVADRTFLQSGCPACYEARMVYARERPHRSIKPQMVLNSDSKKFSRSWYEKTWHRFKSLAKSHPKLAKQWHPTKNGEWKPEDFSSGSDAIAWWQCKKGPDHKWQAAIYSRTGRNHGCPFCTNRRVSVTNSLLTLYPKVAKEWHPKRNGKLKPADVTAFSNDKVWWQCLLYGDHEWETKISSRTKGSGCPYCSHSKVSSLNCLKEAFPYIAAQLHPTKTAVSKRHKLLPFRQRKSGGSVLKVLIMNGDRLSPIAQVGAPDARLAQANRYR